MAEEEEQITIWKSSSSSTSSSQPDSMVSATVGRVMATLLSARPKKLHDAISRLGSAPKRAPLSNSLEDSLWILDNYIRDAAVKEESLDPVLVPMIEHSVKHKGAKNSKQAMILLSWLFQDELLFQAMTRDLASIMLRKDDHYIALGWCLLARGLVEMETTMSGMREKYNELLQILCSCIGHLLYIICSGGGVERGVRILGVMKKQGGFELPTRLSVAAADCVLSLTIALTRQDTDSKILDNRMKSSNPPAPNRPVTLVPAFVNEKKVNWTRISSELSSNKDMRFLLWDLLDELITIVQRLIAWSRKSRSLHGKGLEKVVKWLQEIKQRYGRFQDEAGSQMVRTGVLLLSSCWKHYGVLLHLEDYRLYQRYEEMLEQYLSGIQFFSENNADEQAENRESKMETLKFFLNCLLLLLGRLDGKQFETAMSEKGLQIARVLTTQLSSADEDVIEGAACIFKAAMFRASSSLSDTRHMDAALPLLLHLLDERDGAAKAVVMLVAEYCSLSSDSQCLEEVLKRLAAGNVLQRRNAIDVISEYICISIDSVAVLTHSTWKDIANHLLECLGDEELEIRRQASNLIPMIDPSLVLPTVVRLIYSSEERVQLSASSTLIAVLKYQNQNCDVICMLLDCLSNLSQNPDLPNIARDGKEGVKLDTDRVLKIIPEWSRDVEDWNLLVGPLVDKMLAEPSNATIVKFLSYLSEHLAEAAEVVFRRLLLHTRRQNVPGSSLRFIITYSLLVSSISPEIQHLRFDENCLSEWGTKTTEGQHSLFARLSPLLVIKLLPLRVFNDLQSSLVYGELCDQRTSDDKRQSNIYDTECVAALILNRAFNKFEFQDVRKLAAELCGRIHPDVLFPIISSQLEYAAITHDVLKIKACLFSVCTSLVIRGKDSLRHPALLKCRKAIETVLSWPSLDGDEGLQAQHGCIDCLALMVCTELQASESVRESTSVETSIRGKSSSSGNITRNSFHGYVIHQLTHDEKECVSSSKLGTTGHLSEDARSLSFRLCMANVLISACQKISDTGRKAFSQNIVPRLIQHVGGTKKSEIRAACVQVLFSAVYHLKSDVLLYSSDLLEVSMKSLKQGSEKERMAGAKLMASLMASEEIVVRAISEGLMEARALLSNLSSMDPSSDLRQLCEKLLVCLTSP